MTDYTKTVPLESLSPAVTALKRCDIYPGVKAECIAVDSLPGKSAFLRQMIELVDTDLFHALETSKAI